LLICCERGFEECVNVLLKLGADVDAQDKSGQTALMIVVRKHSRPIGVK
jgi:ankyrin repeat protein